MTGSDFCEDPNTTVGSFLSCFTLRNEIQKAGSLVRRHLLRIFLADFFSRESLEDSHVPFAQTGIQVHWLIADPADNLGSLDRTSEITAVKRIESQPLQAVSESLRLPNAQRRERTVEVPHFPEIHIPFGLAVAYRN